MIQWDKWAEMYALWDEAGMLLGHYNTRDEAQIAFEEYCAELFEED